MKKVQVIGPKTELDECVRVLHAVEIVHIEAVAPGHADDAFLKRLPIEKGKLKEKVELERAAERLKNLLQLMKPPAGWRAAAIATADIHGYIEDVVPIEERVKAAAARIDALNEELSTLDKYQKLLYGFAPIVTRLGGLKNFEVVGLTIEKTRGNVTGLLNAEVERITGGNYEIHVKDLDPTTTGIVLTFPREHEREVKYLLSGKAISEIRLPDEYEQMTLIDALKSMGRKRSELPGLIGAAENEIERLSVEWYGVASGLLKAVEDAIDEIGVLAYAAETRFTFVIEGWVPADMFERLREKFTEVFGGSVLVRELDIRDVETELIPVYIKNPRLLKPFEVFLAALPPPRYGSVDPTPYVALFFPAFFGLIVGDIGYGAVIFAAGAQLKRRFKNREMLSDIFSVLSVCGASAVVFGVLFGELFGDLGERLGILQPLLFHRAEAMKTLLYLALGIGAGHVVLGIIIGAANRLMRGRKREGWAKVAYLVVVVSFLSILAVAFGHLPEGLMTPGVAALVASFVILTVLEGVLGPLEFIKALGNILSYLRIMAVGTASVVMALVANEIGGLSGDIFLGVVVAGLIHLLNILISVMSPAIQSMRLQYVEFFSKFYEGGGRRYMPFKRR